MKAENLTEREWRWESVTEGSSGSGGLGFEGEGFGDSEGEGSGEEDSGVEEGDSEVGSDFEGSASSVGGGDEGSEGVFSVLCWLSGWGALRGMGSLGDPSSMTGSVSGCGRFGGGRAVEKCRGRRA